MNMNNKTIYVEAPIRSEKKDISKHFREIQDRGGAFEIYGMQFDTEKEIDDSLLLTLLSVGDLFSWALPNISRTKSIIRKQLRERDQVKIETQRSNIRLSFKGKSYLLNPKTFKFTQASSDIYLNRVYQTPVQFYPGLCKIKVGHQTFGTKEPVYHFDSNQWAFVVGGQSSIEIFSNGSSYSQRIKSLKLKFGPGGLYIVNDKYQIQNIYEDRYGTQNYNLTRPKRNSEVIGSMFDLVACGKVMFLAQTDGNSFLQIKSISANIEGGNRIQVNYIGHDILAFGAFNQNDSFIVAYFICQFRNQVFYQQHRFAIKAQ